MPYLPCFHDGGDEVSYQLIVMWLSVIRPGCYAALPADPLPEPLPIFGQLCVGAADGVAAAPLDGEVAEVVDVDADGALPCVAAMATVAVPAPSPPASTAVIAALRSSVPLANAMDASPFPASRGSARVE
jgi:hypothetical protein